MSAGTRPTDSELEAVLAHMESDRVERKASLNGSAKGKVEEAICAFANDMPAHNAFGAVFVGVHDDGTDARLPITDDLLRELADIRSQGNIQPLPEMTVEKRTLRGMELAVVLVRPSNTPPVRLRGRTMIRVGPRRAVASSAEEQRLAERRKALDLPFDSRPLVGATLADLDADLFEREYIATVVSADVLAENERTQPERLAALRLADVNGTPTPAGVLVVGKEPATMVPGAYLEFLRLDGTELDAPIVDSKRISGPLVQLMREAEELLRLNVTTAVDIVSGETERRRANYPVVALRELLRNAVLHRDYELSNSPVRLYWFSDRIEIHNPGGPYGQVTVETFGRRGVTDYRNPTLAEAMRGLGFVQRFGVGIPTAERALRDNGNPEAEFLVQPSNVAVIVRRPL